MQTMKQYIIYIFLFSLLAASCSKSLELLPKDTISDATFWKTPADFKLAANNLYLSIEGLNLRDTETDIAFSSGNDVSRGTYQPTETSLDWNDPYIYIRNANNLLEKAATVEDRAGVAVYEGEAYFFRAYNYWKLFRLYGGVPLITKTLDPASEELYTARASRDETVALIFDDLTKAAAALPLASAVATGDKGRVTKGAAEALKARVALFEGTWQKYRGGSNANDYLDVAITSANSVVISNEYALFTGKGAQSYRYLSIDEGDDSPESVFDRRYQRDVSGQDFPYTIDFGTYLPTKKLADMYLCKDGLPITASPLFHGYNTYTSEYDNRDPRMNQTMILPGQFTVRVFFPYAPGVENWPNSPQRNGNTGYITYKYLSEDLTSNLRGSDGNSHSYDFHVLRYAEVLLILAEALYEKNSTISDTDLGRTINVIRDRVDMPALTNAFVATNNLDMLEEIRRERTIELALEGHRYDDLRRWKTAEVELVKDVKGIKIKGSSWQTRAPYNDPTWQARADAAGFIIAEPASARFFDPNKHYLRPLPTREIAKYNDVLTQNPGW